MTADFCKKKIALRLKKVCYKVSLCDRQTDGRTEFSSLYRVYSTCSAVKTFNGSSRVNYVRRAVQLQSVLEPKKLELCILELQ